MKFLLDHDVPVDVSYALVQMGHRVVRLPQVLNPSTQDDRVLEFVSKKVLS